MKFSLANIDAYTPDKVPVSIEMADPQNWQDVGAIAAVVSTRIVELIRFAKADDPEWSTEYISSLPQADDSKGRVFFVHEDMYATLKPQFEVIVWDAVHSVVGDELN